MKVDVENSRYHEVPDVHREFSRHEVRRARYLLRRLRFLETSIAKKGGLADPGANGGGAHAEWELEALEWVLGPDGIEFIEIEESKP